MAERNFPYEDTVILQDDAFNRLVQLIKNYPAAGRKTGIRLVPSEDGSRLQIQNMRSVKIVQRGNKTYLVITDPTEDEENIEISFAISGPLEFHQLITTRTDDKLTPGMFNVYENDVLKQTVLIDGFDENQNLVLGNNSVQTGDTGVVIANKVRGAVWNDYAEYRESLILEPGRCIVETGFGDLELSTKRLQLGANIISDTFGFAIGQTTKAKTPIAVGGRVLAYPLEDRYEFTAGAAVCSGPDGTVSLMTREEIKEWPDAIIGYVSEIPEYKTWGQDNIEVNGRIWIKV